MKTLWSILLMVLSCTSVAQPNTEIYLFELKVENGSISVSNSINISNNNGYDNQPSFWPDGKSILYSRTINGQTDIARYFIESGTTEFITNTKQGSEYSPTPMPDGKRVSSIRLDTTGLQLLYAYDSNGEGEILAKDMVIGYHAWITDTKLVAFVLGEPATMEIINTENGSSEVVAENIGRSLHKIPNSELFSYVDKSRQPWVIKSMNPKTKKIKTLAPVLGESEDYFWLSSEQIITGDKGKLWLWEIDKEGWNEVVDMTSYGFQTVTRLAVSSSRDKLAIVVE